MIILIVIILLAVAVVVYWNYRKQTEEKGPGGVVVPSVEMGKAVENPLEEMPVFNPYEEVANPFTEIYKNPFK